MTDKMIVPNSIQDSTAVSLAEATEPSEFQQFEFWVNGVKRIIKIPMHSESELNAETANEISVEPGEIDEVQSCPLSADPIVIDPEFNDGDSRLAISASHEESMLTNFVELDAVGQKEQCTEPQNNQNIAGQNDQGGIVDNILSTSNGSRQNRSGKSLKIRTELQTKQLHQLSESGVAKSVNQSIFAQSKIRIDVPVIPLYASNIMSKTLLPGLFAPSVMTKSIDQRVERSKVPLIPSDYIKSSNSNIPMTLPNSAINSLVQTVNSGLPLIMTNSASQTLVKNSDTALPAGLYNGSVTYILQPRWQPNNATSDVVNNSIATERPGMTKQPGSQCSSTFKSKQNGDALPPQTSCNQLQLGDNQMNSSRTSRNVNLLQGQQSAPTTSLPILLGSSATQVRKVKITTDTNGSCIISVDGLTDRSPATSSSDKPTSSNMSNILTTRDVLHRAMPLVPPNGTAFRMMSSSALQNFQMVQLVPSDRGTLHLIPSNALGNHRPLSLEPLSILPKDKAFCLKPPNCQVSSLPRSSCTSQNVRLLGSEPLQAKHTDLAVQSTRNNVQLVGGALCAASDLASSTSSLPSGTFSYCSLPSSLSVLVKNSGDACSASSKSNSLFVYYGASSGHANNTSSNSSVPSALFTPTCLSCALPVTDVPIYRNTVSVPSVCNTTNSLGITYNKPKPQFRVRGNRFCAPFQSPVTEYSRSFEAGQSTTAITDISQNSILSQDTRTRFSKYRANNRVATVSTLASSAVSAAVTTSSVSVANAASLFMVSSASAWDLPTFPPWSGSTVSKSRDGFVPRRAPLLLGNAVLPSLSSNTSEYNGYPPKTCSQTSSEMTGNLSKSHCFMPQISSSAYNTVHSVIPAKAAHALTSTVSYPSDTSSHLTFSLAQQPLQSSSTVHVTKSIFSFYNSRFKFSGCTSEQKSAPLFTNLSSNASLNSATSVTSVLSSKSSSGGPADICSSLIPISVEFFESSTVSGDVPKKRKHKSHNSMRKNGSCNTSSPTSIVINLSSDSESTISSSESWTSDYSVTIGKPNRHRRRKLMKRKAYENDRLKNHSMENSKVNHQTVECFVSLENLYLNGKTSIDISDSAENLVCCKFLMQKSTSARETQRETVSRKKSYRLPNAVNYISDTD